MFKHNSRKNFSSKAVLLSLLISVFPLTTLDSMAKTEKSKGSDGEKQVVVDKKDNNEGASQAAKDEVEKATVSKRPIKDKWAIVIGVNKFKDKSIPTLKYATNDAKDFAKFLIEKGNFARDHVLLLLDKDATKHNIMANLADTWLPERVLPDDLVVIYASTHGSPKEIDRGGDNFLVAHDTKKSELFTTGIMLQDLAPTIKQRTHCDRVVLILDACNSGAAKVGGKGLFRSTNFDVNALAGKGQIVISSSDADQRSWESKRYKNGVFTRSLIEVLSKEKESNNGHLEEAFDKLKDSVQSEVKFDRKAFQTPVMHSEWEGEPLRLTAKPVAPRAIDTADTLSPYTYEKVLYKLAHPPAAKPVAVNKPVSTPTPVQTPPAQPVQQVQTVQQTPVQPTGPQIIVQPTAPQKPIVVPDTRYSDAWYKYRSKNSKP